MHTSKSENIFNRAVCCGVLEHWTCCREGKRALSLHFPQHRESGPKSLRCFHQVRESGAFSLLRRSCKHRWQNTLYLSCFTDPKFDEDQLMALLKAWLKCTSLSLILSLNLPFSQARFHLVVARSTKKQVTKNEPVRRHVQKGLFISVIASLQPCFKSTVWV